MNRPVRALAVALAVLLTVAAVAPAAAQPSNAEAFADLWNENVDRLPGLAKGDFAGQTVLLELTDTGEQYTVVTDDDARITSVTEGTPDGCYAKTVTTSESAIRGIVTAEDPSAAYDDARSNGDLGIGGGAGCGTLGDAWNGVKASVQNFFLSLL